MVRPNAVPALSTRAAWALGAVAALATLAACPRDAPPAPVAPPALSAWSFTSDGHELRAFGTEAPPSAAILVVAHGGPGVSHESVAALARLAGPSLRVVFWDQRGVGASDPVPPAEQGLDAQVRDLEALRSDLGADRVVVAGQSWGGLVAMAYAVAHPDRVRALLLLDAIPASREELDQAFERFHERRRALTLAGVVPAELPEATGGDCTAATVALAPVYFHDPAHPLARSIGGATCRAGVLEATWERTGDFDLRLPLRALAIPTLVLAGDDDPFGAKTLEDVVDALDPDVTTVETLHECGHNGFVECPGPWFAAARAFLDGVLTRP
ncbi:MAG: alpha/beta hydrolase [Myxococcales bacterium]|nr:alpha/beta hydrolase [Myxococcales bacterium]